MLAIIQKGDNSRCTDATKSLRIDEACLSVLNQNNRSLSLLAQVDECYKCDALPWANLPPNSNTTLLISTKYPVSMYSVDTKQNCSTKFTFTEHGYYGWNLTDGNCSSVYSIKEPVDPYIPLLAAFMVYTFVALVWFVGSFLVRSDLMARLLRRDTTDVQSDLGRLQEGDSPPQPPMLVTKSSTRARVLDTFRGIAIVLMIFVNNGGGKYVFFNHSPWNGLTVADLVLPWFAWTMGFTIVISMRTQLRISMSRSRIILRALRRSLILIVFGLIVNAQSHKSTLDGVRFTGILQLLAVSYFICATIEAFFMKAQRSFQYGRLMFLLDILDGWVQWLIIIVISTTHTLLTFVFPVPNCPTGYLGPGGLHDHGQHVNCTGGAAGYIDRAIFGNHMYSHDRNTVYGEILPQDPEGLMNTISAVLIVYMGVQAGRIMLSYHQDNSRIIRWLSWSIGTGIIAGALCGFSKENGAIPVNKHMMTLSYVLGMSSLAFLTNTILYILIHLQSWSGAPFCFAGMNPIFLYIGHYFTKRIFPFAWNISGVETHSSLLGMNLWTTTLWVIIAYFLYKKDIFITV